MDVKDTNKNLEHQKEVMYQTLAVTKTATHWQVAPSEPSEPAGHTEPAAPSVHPSGISAAAWPSV